MEVKEPMEICLSLYEKYKSKEEDRLDNIRLLERTQENINSDLERIDKNLEILRSDLDIVKKNDELIDNLKNLIEKSLIIGLVLAIIGDLIFPIESKIIKVLISIVMALIPPTICGLIYDKFVVKKNYQKPKSDCIDDMELKIEIIDNLGKKQKIEKEQITVSHDLKVYQNIHSYQKAMEFLNNIIEMLRVNPTLEEQFLIPSKEEDEIEWITNLNKKLKRNSNGEK